MIDLREKDRQIIIDIANGVFSTGTQLWAYGSRIKGSNHDASDLDLVVRAAKDDEFDLEQLTNFKTALQSSTIPILVQALSWQHIPEPFQKTILQGYEVLHIVPKDSGKIHE
ncbi:MAG: hypothetical protein RPR40_04155 [Bermanella sp.]|jgi:hypothetical protein